MINPECIRHTTVARKRPLSGSSTASIATVAVAAPAAAVAAASVSPTRDGDLVVSPTHLSSPAGNITFETPTSSQLTPSRPTGCRPQSTIRRTATGRVIVETHLSPREQTIHDIDPNVLYRHAEIASMHFSQMRHEVLESLELTQQRPLSARTAVSMSSGLTSASNIRATPTNDSFEQRVQESESRMRKLRTAKRPVSASARTANNPPSLQLLVARLTASRRETDVAASGSDAAPDASQQQQRVATPQPLNPLDAAFAAFKDFSATDTASGKPASPVTSPTKYNDAAGGRSGSGSPTSRRLSRARSFSSIDVCDAKLSKTERLVLARVQSQYASIKDELAHAKGDHRKLELQQSMERLGLLSVHCRSALNGVDLSDRKRRDQFSSRLSLDHFSQEELDSRLLYGEVAQRLLVEEQKARKDALMASLASAQRTSLQSDHPDYVRDRRLSSLRSAKDAHDEATEHWRRRAEQSHTLSYQERLNSCARQERERRASMWSSLLTVILYPRWLLLRRASRMERLLLASKRKEEHVAHFVEMMRRCLARRRKRVARRTLLQIKLATTLLVSYFYHRRRRAAVREVVEWFHEYKRRLPATDIIHNFKRAIVRCQRMVRALIARRNREICWILLKMLEQSGAAVRWAPVKMSTNSLRHRASSVSLDGGNKGSRRQTMHDTVMDRIVDQVVPPFSIRLDVARRMRRNQATEYVAATQYYLKRRRLLKSQKAQGHKVASVLDVPRPPHMMTAPPDVIAQGVQECKKRFRVWLMEKISALAVDHPVPVPAPSLKPPGSSNQTKQQSVQAMIALEAKLCATIRDPTETVFVTKWGEHVLGAAVPIIPDTAIAMTATKSDLSSAADLLSRRRSQVKSTDSRLSAAGGGAQQRGSASSSSNTRTVRDAASLYQRILRQL